MDKQNRWMTIALGGIVLSIGSLLLPIVTYTSPYGETWAINIIGVLNGELTVVFWYYKGDFLRDMSLQLIWFFSAVIALVAVCALYCALKGIFSMSKQYESNKPYLLARMGLIGTAIPSVILILLYLMSATSFEGTIRIGFYPLITPLAMVCAIAAVTARHRLTVEEARLQTAAAEYIRVAGDLPIVNLGEDDRYV